MKSSRIIFWGGILLVLISGCESNDYKVIQSSASTPQPLKQPQKIQNASVEISPPAASGLKRSETKQSGIKHNPFLSWEEERALLNPKPPPVKEKKIIILDSLKLSAIFYSPVSSHSYAIVEGQIVREKDKIGNKELTRIKTEEIILQDEEGEYIVRLNPLKNIDLRTTNGTK